MTGDVPFKSLYGTMKLNIFFCVILVGVVAFVIYRSIQKSRSNILNEWTGRSLSTRTKSEEAILPPGWKKGAYVN